jgi:hypothetical protein
MERVDGDGDVLQATAYQMIRTGKTGLKTDL